ncbi:hypothetical protein B0J11DRAFT_525353 [Dendryphion nanum]|uniref:Secreted protein n=1 Tax=Dendryphion nanum TaxID=256645 RepID=A0A9P9DZH3_9PLEO|nr:hypothetical protein B0J11DRAFT_525353 [Dendryphion nanum]
MHPLSHSPLLGCTCTYHFLSFLFSLVRKASLSSAVPLQDVCVRAAVQLCSCAPRGGLREHNTHRHRHRHRDGLGMGMKRRAKVDERKFSSHDVVMTALDLIRSIRTYRASFSG